MTPEAKPFVVGDQDLSEVLRILLNTCIRVGGFDTCAIPEGAPILQESQTIPVVTRHDQESDKAHVPAA